MSRAPRAASGTRTRPAVAGPRQLLLVPAACWILAAGGWHPSGSAPSSHRDVQAAAEAQGPSADRVKPPGQQARQDTAGPAGKDPRRKAIEAARHVLSRVVRAARENASSGPGLRQEGDELTNRYVRQAAHAALELPSDTGPRALVTAIGLALDDSDMLRTNPLTRASVSQLESAEERAGRLKVLGRPTMRGRRDLAQHFAVSAYLAAELGSILADAAGAAKELLDAQGGSGFSFADLAADEAGITFAERLLSGELPLREVADRFSVADYLPPIDGLPEGLSAEEFQRDYTGESAARYEQLRSEIRSRVRALPPYRSRRKEQP